MPAKAPHDWRVSPAEARALQEQFRDRVVREDGFAGPALVAGTDIAFEDGLKTTRGVIAVLSYPGLDLGEYKLAKRPTEFPYVPGLLSFREIPVLLDAYAALEHRPDVILCDGQGIAHPRRFGLACHLGVILDRPTIGVAKSRLVGQHSDPPAGKGGHVPLMDGDEVIGAVLRTRESVKPVYVSTGHRVSLEAAVALTMSCVTRYRLPETTRWADRLAAKPGAG